jgi:hypothetical protein
VKRHGNELKEEKEKEGTGGFGVQSEAEPEACRNDILFRTTLF